MDRAQLKADLQTSCHVQLNPLGDAFWPLVDRAPFGVLSSTTMWTRRLAMARTRMLCAKPARTSLRLHPPLRQDPSKGAKRANKVSEPNGRTMRRARFHPRRPYAESTPHHRRLIWSHLNTTAHARTDSSSSNLHRAATERERGMRGARVRSLFRRNHAYPASRRSTRSSGSPEISC